MGENDRPYMTRSDATVTDGSSCGAERHLHAPGQDAAVAVSACGRWRTGVLVGGVCSLLFAGCSEGSPPPGARQPLVDPELAGLREKLAACTKELSGLRRRSSSPDSGAAIQSDAAAGARQDGSVEEKVESADAPSVRLFAASIRHNSAGTSELQFRVRNCSDRSVVAFTFQARLTDSFERPVFHDIYGAERGNVFRGVQDEPRRPIRSGQEARVGIWPMYNFDRATHAQLQLTEVRFADGTSWTGNAQEDAAPCGRSRRQKTDRLDRELQQFLAPGR